MCASEWMSVWEMLATTASLPFHISDGGGDGEVVEREAANDSLFAESDNKKLVETLFFGKFFLFACKDLNGRQKNGGKKYMRVE